MKGLLRRPPPGYILRELVQALARKGIELAQVTLHVGHKHVSQCEDRANRRPSHAGRTNRGVGAQTVAQIRLTRERGNRVVAVGTTVVRALETAARGGRGIEPFQGPAELFITQGFEFQVIDAMVTNFHLPRTTLLMLVSAFVGVQIRSAPPMKRQWRNGIDSIVMGMRC